MVTITDVKEVETQDGKVFTSIQLQGEPQLLQSATTGNFYLTANKTRVTTLLPINVCKMMIGQKLPGSVDKVHVEPYEHVNKETGEVRTLDYIYVYSPEKQNVQTMQSEQTELPHYFQDIPKNFEMGGVMMGN